VADQIPADAEVVFLALPHGAAAQIVPGLVERGATIVDLGPDFRLRDAADYPRWYGFNHPRSDLLAAAVYGLPELHRGEIESLRESDVRIVGAPGCYPTAALLALAPLARSLAGTAVVDAKSGVSGAGRGLKPSSHAGSVLDNLSAYRVGSHQHAPEIAQALGFPVSFVPHLLPIRRGLLATCYATPTAGDLRERLEEAYADAPAVRVLPADVGPELSRVQGTDAAEVALFEDAATGRAIVVCALDNLGKGAAGQAVQNANVALGLEETLGLRLAGVLV
jgi:N-acetyl-gamma-glutamyl-phosphate reductase